jgi:hypothetical protein
MVDLAALLMSQCPMDCSVLLLKPSSRPSTHAQANKLCLQIDIRRLRTTTRFECGDRESAQTIPAE